MNSRSPAKPSSNNFLANQSGSLSWPPALSLCPSQPGVYSFLNAAHKVLYVGKAKNLRRRLHSYTQTKRLLPRQQKMLSQTSKLKYQVLASELEALLIEAELIRLHQPAYNILLKDDRSPLYLQVTDQPYPSLKTLRKKQLYRLPAKQTQGTILGPFPSATKLKEVLKLVRPIFPWCNQAESVDSNSATARACFYYHLDLCPGACINKISPQDYQANIKALVLFLQGKKKTVLNQLQQKMHQLAKEQRFEQAAQVRNQIQLIRLVTSKNYRLKPELILPSFSQNKTQAALLHLRRMLTSYLNLPKKYPLNRLEGYDVSNLQGQAAAVSMVVFIQGQPAKKHYRLFNIRGPQQPNDYYMLQEAISRRQQHPEWGKPNLLVIDGGKGQLRAVLKVWQGPQPIISIAKNPDRLIIPTQIDRSKRLKINYQIIKLASNHPSLQLIQHLRDESHRFAQKQHHKLRAKQFLKD
ncbi:MAG: hypothetical protein GF390_01615 [Candidatus Pacebacteria bacterium]|nr:hypothetical protein [Candidatus Paceibacterota bacterium]